MLSHLRTHTSLSEHSGSLPHCSVCQLLSMLPVIVLTAASLSASVLSTVVSCSRSEALLMTLQSALVMSAEALMQATQVELYSGPVCQDSRLSNRRASVPFLLC
jgi:hypothetical protein